MHFPLPSLDKLGRRRPRSRAAATSGLEERQMTSCSSPREPSCCTRSISGNGNLDGKDVYNDAWTLFTDPTRSLCRNRHHVTSRQTSRPEQVFWGWQRPVPQGRTCTVCSFSHKGRAVSNFFRTLLPPPRQLVQKLFVVPAAVLGITR